MRKLAFALIFISSLIAIRLVAAPSSKPVIEVMEFSPADFDQWDEDVNTDDVTNVDNFHYFFSEDKMIDLTVVREDEDYATDLNVKGKDEFVADILKGQNIINQMFDVGETKLLDSKLERDSEISVLTLHTKMHLPDGEFERVARYHIAQGQYLQAELRWRVDADPAIVAKAKKSFDNGTLSLFGRKGDAR